MGKYHLAEMESMLYSYWGVTAPCTPKVKSLIRRHCQGYPVLASELYKELKGSDDQANRDLVIKLIANRAPVNDKTSLKDLEAILVQLDKGQPVQIDSKAAEVEFEAYQLEPVDLNPVCVKSYCKKGRCLASLVDSLIASATTSQDQQAADRMVVHYVTKHLLAQGYNLGSFLNGSSAIAWSESKAPLTINWESGQDRIEMFIGQLAIIKSSDSLVLLDNPHQPIVPNNMNIYFEADREGTYPMTSFHNPGRILTIEVYDRRAVLQYLPKLAKPYTDQFLHQVRRWIELDNYLKSIEFNSLNAPIEDRACILDKVCRTPANEQTLQQAIINNISNKVASTSMDPVCKIVFDAWKQTSETELEGLLMTCLVDGKVSLDKVASAINQELATNVMIREQLQRQVRHMLKS